MEYSLALLFSLLQLISMATAAPLPVEVVKMKSKVKWMAEHLVVRLNRNFQVTFMMVLFLVTQKSEVFAKVWCVFDWC